MRTGRINRDGSMEISIAVAKFSKDRDRYDRFTAGEAIADIAVTDDITPEKAIMSVRQGGMMAEAEQMLELRGIKHASALAVEKLRTKARIQNETRILDGLETLLKGKRTITSIDKETGQILTEVIDDPEVISMGLEHARKILSIDERPAPNQTIVSINNNQQNNFGESQGPKAETYEERLKRIRNRQLSESRTEPVVMEAEVIKAETIVTPEEPKPEQKDWENF
jgi:hypothetical protein